MSTHAMIDLETLGTQPDCTVLTLGGIKFNPYNNKEPAKGLYLRLDVDEQSTMNRSVDPGTLEWWGKQKKEIQDEALGDENRTSVADTLAQLNKWLIGCDQIWCQGPAFDMVILENLYRQMKQPVPWNFWQVRDSRTLFSMMPVDPRKAIQTDAHNALADCYYQAKCVQQSFKHFGITQ